MFPTVLNSVGIKNLPNNVLEIQELTVLGEREKIALLLDFEATRCFLQVHCTK